MTKEAIAVDTRDGRANAAIFTGASARRAAPGIILYMDAFGPRPALDQMAERLAEAG